MRAAPVLRRGRLPVHVLLDIDGTLLQIIKRPTRTSPGDGATPEAGDHESCDPPTGAHRLVFNDPRRGHEQVSCDVLLRPHALSFLRRLAVQRVLDTPSVAVALSLYTRQPVEYSRAVAALLAALLLSPHHHNATAEGGLRVFHQTLGATSCRTRGEAEGRAASGGGSGGASPGDPWSGMAAALRGDGDWCKSVQLSGCPFTTVLVDDKVGNFVEDEEATGHCVRVPTFAAVPRHYGAVGGGGGGLDSVGWEDDEVLRVPPGPTPAPSPVSTKPSHGDDLLAALLPAQSADPSDTAPPSLFSVIAAFVAVCEASQAELCSLHASWSMDTVADSDYPAVGASWQQRARALHAFNFLERPEAQEYRTALHAFEAAFL